MITQFSGQFAWLSNFWPYDFHLDGAIWPTVEHYYQAMKTNSLIEQMAIQNAVSAAQAKRLGRHITLRSDWGQVKDEVMLKALRAKFAPGTVMAEWLLGTRFHALVEGNNWHDTYWGECYCPKCHGKGQNALGRLLMNVRSELRRL